MSAFLHFYTFSMRKIIYYPMKIYFLSSVPCMLSLNGVFFGVTDKFERFADVCLTDRVFAKFTPEGGLPIGFFITEALLSTPPAGCEVYLLQNAIAIYARDFTPMDCTLRPIAQQRFDDTLVSVFQQGHIQVSIQSPLGFFTSTLPPSFASCRLSMHADLVFLEGENHLAVYTKSGKCVLNEQVLTFSVENNELNATLPLSDSLGRVADCAWILQENGCTRTRFTLRQSCTHTGEMDEEKITEEVLPYAFFESVLFGVNFADFLSDELAGKANYIVDFLGDFQGVCITDNPYICGLIREKAPRLFEVVYFTVTVENGKITDVTG